MKLDEYLLNERNVIFVAEPREEELYREIAGLQDSYHKLFQESQAFSMSIRGMLKHRFPLGQDYLPSLPAPRPTLADFHGLTVGLTDELRKLESFIRMALSDEREKLQQAVWHDNIETVLDTCSAVNSLSSLISGGCVSTDLGTLRSALKQLYKLYSYKTEKPDVQATLRRWSELLPNLDDLVYRARQKSYGADRLARDQLERTIEENDHLRREIARLEAQTNFHKENVSRVTVWAWLTQERGRGHPDHQDEAGEPQQEVPRLAGPQLVPQPLTQHLQAPGRAAEDEHRVLRPGEGVPRHRAHHGHRLLGARSGRPQGRGASYGAPEEGNGDPAVLLRT